MKVFAPLKADSSLIQGDTCALCKKPFHEGQRVTLAPAREVQFGYENVPAVPLHATCALRGLKTKVGEIERIKDGEGSPYPVLTTDGQQHTLEECDL